MDIEDLITEAWANVERSLDEFLEMMEGPAMDEALAVRWMLIPDEIKEAVKQQYPQMYARIMEMSSHESNNTSPNSY